MATVTKYTYSIATDTATGLFNSDSFKKELSESSSISISLSYLNTSLDVLDIYMKDVLAEGEVTALTNLLKAHVGQMGESSGLNPEKFWFESRGAQNDIQ